MPTPRTPRAARARRRPAPRGPGLLPALAVASLLLSGPGASRLVAQAARGVVVRGDSIAVPGAMVTLLDSLGTAAASTLSDEFGAFSLRAPQRGTFRLRTEAVGFATVTSFPFTLATAEVAVRRVQLIEATAALRSIEVRDRLQCDVRPAEGTLVALLWSEARKSLAVAAVSRERAPPLAFDTDDIEYDSTFLRVRAASRVTTIGRAEGGYRADVPRALQQLGYERRVDTTSLYYAPDARVLLSDEFAASHCFRIEPDDPTSIRRVGLAFAPVAVAPGRRDVAGVLWLDRETFALDRVEFRYDPVISADFPDSTFGGRVRFSRLPTGHVVVTQWVLRMPIFALADDGRLARSGQTSQMLIRAERREAVAGVKVARGRARAFDAPPEPLPVVNAAPRRAAGAPTCDGVAPVAGNGGALVGSVLDARDRAVGGARVRAAWHQPVAVGGRVVFREQWVEAGADAYGRYALCALPRGVRLSVQARSSNSASPRQRLVLDETGGPPVVTLEVAGAARGAAAPGTGTIVGRLVGREGRPVAGAEVRVFPGIERLTTDSTGVFRVESAPPGLREFFVRRVGYAPQMLAVEVQAGDTTMVAVALEPAAQMLAPVTVEARVTSHNLAGFELRREQRVGGGTFIGPDELRARDASSVSNVLRSLTRLRFEESQMTGDVRMYGRGGDNPDGSIAPDKCTMRMVVDGALMPDGFPLSGLPPVREIAAIEVYQSVGAVPAMFSYAMPECGLVVVWTRTFDP